MICKNCGAVIDGNAAFCGNCGSSVQKEQQTVSVNAQNQVQGDYTPPAGYSQQDQYQQQYGQYRSEQGNQNQMSTYPLGAQQSFNFMTKKLQFNKKNILYIAIPVVALVLVVSIVLGVLQATVFGYKNTVKNYVVAFEDVDGDAMYELTADKTKDMLEAVFTLAKAAYSLDLGDYDDMTLGLIELQYIEYLENEADDFFYSFDRSLGNAYKLDYDVVYTEKASKDDLKQINKVISRLMRSEDYNFKDLMYVEVDITGSSGDLEQSKTLYLILSKEGMKWKVLFASPERFNFNDLSGIDLDDLLDLF